MDRSTRAHVTGNRRRTHNRYLAYQEATFPRRDFSEPVQPRPAKFFLNLFILWVFLRVFSRNAHFLSIYFNMLYDNEKSEVCRPGEIRRAEWKRSNVNQPHNWPIKMEPTVRSGLNRYTLFPPTGARSFAGVGMWEKGEHQGTPLFYKKLPFLPQTFPLSHYRAMLSKTASRRPLPKSSSVFSDSRQASVS